MLLPARCEHQVVTSAEAQQNRAVSGSDKQQLGYPLPSRLVVLSPYDCQGNPGSSMDQKETKFYFLKLVSVKLLRNICISLHCQIQGSVIDV